MTKSRVIVHWTQVVLVNRGTDSSAQVRARLLVSSKMYPAVNARVRNVIRNLLKRGVLQDDVGHHRIGQGDRMSSFALETSQHFGCAVAGTAVV